MDFSQELIVVNMLQESYLDHLNQHADVTSQLVSY